MSEAKKSSAEHIRSIPELRFPEFHDKWKKSKVGESCKILMCKRIFSDQTSQKGDVPFYKIGTLGSIADTFISRETFELYKAKYNFPNVGEVLITCSGTVGKCIPYNGQDAYYQDSNIVWLHNPKQTVVNELLYYLMNKVNWASLNSTTITRIYGDDLRGLKLSYPAAKSEQQKIASFLSAVDTKIEQLSKKKELLETYKKGVMQQLFSQQIRFKDEAGNDYPDWEEVEFGKIFSFHSTNSLSRDKLNYNYGKIYNIHYGDIHTKFASQFKLEKESVPWINPEVDTSNLHVENYLQVGDLVIADASEDYADIGKTIEISEINEKPIVAGLHTLHARPKRNYLALGFAGQQVQTWSIRKQVMTIAQGTKVLGLSANKLGKVKLSLPCLEEQTKIANFLSAIDEKIRLVSEQLEGTQQFKKGLLQKMFV